MLHQLTSTLIAPSRQATIRERHACASALRTGRLLALAVLACCGGCATAPSSSDDPGSVRAVNTPARGDASRINVQLGVNYLGQGQLQLAQQKLERALVENPDNPDAHAAMALLDERLGKSKDSDREYRRALSLSHRAPAVLNSYGVYLCSHGRGEEGVRQLEESASNPLYNTPWAAHTNAGVCLLGLHREGEAMTHFERALQSNPGYAEAAFRAADLDFSLHRYVEARTRVDLYLLSYRPTADLLLLGWRIASAQQDATAQARYAARLSREFPDSSQAHAVAMGTAGRG
jgi:type IV pilus assembly protein PilF